MSHDCREELHQAGSRATPGRLALLRVLEGARKPLAVKEMEQKLPELNPVTLYRALEDLAHAGLVRRGVKGRVTRFEYAGKSHHHHLICVDCGFLQKCAAC